MGGIWSLIGVNEFSINLCLPSVHLNLILIVSLFVRLLALISGF